MIRERVYRRIGFVLLMVFLATACQSDSQPDAPSSQGDPYYAEQWHLKNTGQNIGTPGEDINVEPVWESCGNGNTCRGEGVVLAVVDGGLQLMHEDLVANVVPGSYNYVNGEKDPMPVGTPRSDFEAAEMAHGTAIAGLAAARDQNGLGGRGVAPRAGLMGFNLLGNDSSFNEADSMIRGMDIVSISMNSWGIPDGLGQLGASETTWREAIRKGVTEGRQGKGIVYLWAAGNGGLGNPLCTNCKDNSNHDGQANDRGVIAVAAVNESGKRSSYSEKGANLWIAAPGGEFCKENRKAITTTDLMGPAGFNPNLGKEIDYPNQNYTACMNGTSASVPIAGGVVALVLQANPLLSWRDVRWVLAKSARQVDPDDPGSVAFSADVRDQPGWKTNGGGLHVNHQYGFGVVDAQAAVRLAKEWKNLAPLKESKEYTSSPRVEIPDGDSVGVSDSIQVTGASISRIEWIEVMFDSDHEYSGDLDISLIHEATGTISKLAEIHDCLNLKSLSLDCVKYDHWIFGDARHLGESSEGQWTLTVRDLKVNKQGHFSSWGLKFYGT